MTRRTLAAACAALGILACGEPSTAPTEIAGLPRPLSTAEQALIDAGNDFAFSLFREVSRADPGGNVFVSPLSASMALGMTLNGADGTTFDAMRATLGFDQASQEEINEGYRSLTELLLGLDPRTEIRIANSVWYKDSYSFEQPFFESARTFFDAEVQGLDFSDPASPGKVNAWVSRGTNGKITSIIDRIAPGDVMFLINAVYFKGTWQDQFDRSLTHDAEFHAADGAVLPMRLMHRHGALRYAATPDYEAADLRYGNSAFSMTVLLPREGTDINAFVASLNEEVWAALTGRFAESELDLYLPRFKLEYDRTLNDDLTALGMGVAFTDAADFRRMSRGGGLYISKVRQKTYVDVNEEGTEAAAVTSVTIRETSAPPAMRVDRPFVFAIRERFSGTILFIGKVMRVPPGT